MVVKVSAYGDDLTLFLASRGSFEVVTRVLADFGRAARARVNLGKSDAMGFGQSEGLVKVPAYFMVERAQSADFGD